jgi:DNA-binding protein
MSKKSFLSLNAMDKIIRDSNAKRVSDDAKEALANVLQEKGTEIAKEAKKLAEHAGRKTVTKKDILLAVTN